MEKLLTAEEIAEKLGVKISTIYSWTHEKKIPRVQGMRLLRFREREILDWLGRQAPAPNCLNSHLPLKRKTLNSHVDNLVERAKSEVRG